MHVEQRHVTTVNLQDGQPRDFLVFRDPRGCKVSCVTGDEVLNVLLSYPDFQRLCQTVVQPNGGDPRSAASEAVAVAPPALPTASSIRVERRQVTTVALHPSRSREFSLSKDERGYKLVSVSKEEVVTVLLSPNDFRKLWQQVARWEWRDVRKDLSTAITATPPALAPAERCEVAVPVAPAVAAAATYPWGSIDWLCFN
ncbi:MAG TPA: hypothetical protein VKA46_40140 [Gemmataceae bacterium]|nr:hypothetical protein [Gemmataceae bacterium]